MNPTITILEEENLFIQQFQLSNLSQLSYYVECKGIAAVINPVRDICMYSQLAISRNASIQFVLLTEIPCDYISGHLNLQKLLQPQIFVGPQSNCKFEYKTLKETEVILLGDYQLRQIYTPGHSMESCCYLLENATQNCKPLAIFSGNTLLMGDTCGINTAQAQTIEDQTYLASLLYDSLRNKILTLQDTIVIYPGHTSGYRLAPTTQNGLKDTLLNQKLVNKSLQEITREQFIQQILKISTEVPKNYYFISQLNRDLLQADELESKLQQARQYVSVDEFLKLQQQGSIILDCRPYADFLNGFIEKSVNMTLSTKIELWISMMYSCKNNNFVIICQTGKEEETFTRLARIGLDFAIKGTLQGGIDTYIQSGKLLQKVPNIDAAKFKNEIYQQQAPYSMDVRDEQDFQAGHLENSLNVPICQMSEAFSSNIDHFPKDQPVYVFCNGGGRAPIGCSVLMSNGYQNVVHVVGGMSKLKENGIQLTKE
ncbi:hypothetical protein ABPG72_007986 [Tetrahymena utriculariae]